MQRKFHISLLLFFTPVILGYLAIEYLSRELPSGYARNAAHLASEKQNIEVLILGSSQMKDAVNAALIAQNTINLASGDQHHDTDFKLLKGLYPELPQLHTVVLEVSYSHFELPHNGKHFWKNSVYLEYYEVNVFERPVYFKDRLIYLSNPGFFSEKLLNHYWYKEDTVGFNRQGFDTLNYSGLFRKLNYNENRIAPTRFKINTHPDPEIFKTNIALFFELLQFLRERGIRVIICKAPMYKSYLPVRHPQILKRRDSILEVVLRKYPEIRLLDREEDTLNFRVRDYWNQSHLNPDGARKFTALLQQELN